MEKYNKILSKMCVQRLSASNGALKSATSSATKIATKSAQ